MTTIILKSEYDNKPIELELSLPLLDVREDLEDMAFDYVEDNSFDAEDIVNYLYNNDNLVSLEYHISDEPVFTTLKNLELNK